MLRTLRPTLRTTRNLCQTRAAACNTLRTPQPLRCLSSLSLRHPPPRQLSHTAIHLKCARQLSSIRRYSTKHVNTFPDPERPGLYYHLYHPPSADQNSTPVFAISFLQNAPRSADAPAVIGWLPALEGEQPGLNDFRENPKFTEVLHEAIQGGLRDGVDDVQINGAIQTQQGWMHIHDERNVPALGRIGDPDDIIASVRVEDGKILAETYQPMPAYRLCTADGVLKLTDGLFERLLQLLEEREREQRP